VDRQKIERWWRQVIGGGKPGAVDQASRAMLLAASLPFEAGARMRSVFFTTGMLATIKVPVPVISFGNLTVGGTGKTPAVIWCAKYLTDKGLTPGIASRGYSPEHTKVEAPNDEAALIKEALPGVPHVWNADRIAAARVLLADHHVNAIILDDGFQHRRIHRTLDFLLLDALNPFGYGFMLPRGYLREPKSALKRATTVIITRANLVSRDELQTIIRDIRLVDENAKIAEAIHKPTGLYYGDGTVEAPESLKGKKVIAFCGIGNPSAFVTTLTHLGAKVVGVRAFEDHHAYCDYDFECISKDAAAHGAELIVTTQKDRVKTGWRDCASVKMAELRIEFELIRGREGVENALNFLVNGLREQAR
jgi:tetraacyldisaccharide 4'-kinase